MNEKRVNFILLRVLDQIQQGNKDVRYGIDKSVARICNEEVFPLSRYSVFCFLMLYLLVINHPSAFRAENSF